MAKQSAFKVPRSVMCCGVKITVKLTSKLMFDGDDELHGCFCPETLTIHVSKHSDIKSTLLHEMVHAILHVTGCSSRLTNSSEESIVTAIEYGLRDYFTLLP